VTEPDDAGFLPHFPVQLPTPDLRPWLDGNLLPGVWSFDGPEPGPHVAVLSLVHGNEIAGALVLDAWLRQGLRPRRGRLSLVFANLDAFARFDPADPTLSRFVDEDLNRVWCGKVLDGPRRSAELARARALRPLIDTVDVLLDLHSMLWPSDPLIIVGESLRARELALRLGTPPLVVADQGHRTGRRLIDYAPFADPAGRRTAILVEGGQHWQTATQETLEACARALLLQTGLWPQPELSLPSGRGKTGMADGAAPGARLAEVTRTVTAGTHGFAFVRPFHGGAVIPARNTLLALDGETEIRTPHDDCLLVMPCPRTMRGHTAVRLARFLPAGN
jgi:hypothetical protein